MSDGVQRGFAMTEDAADNRRPRTGAPWFVASCAAGFLIIAGCAVYFLFRFFL